MEISNPHHQMIMGSHQFEELLGASCSKLSTANNDHQHGKNNDNQGGGGGEKKPRPHPEQALKCPRCESSNTKFCYYNNYSLTQPRYFCKGCRRYWTQGGTLRNVPVGGGCRKNHKRSTSSSSSPGNKNVSTHKPSPNSLITTTATPHSNPNQSLLSSLSFDPAAPPFLLGPPNPNPNPNPTGFLDILRAGFLDQYTAAAAAANLPASGFNSSTSPYSYGVDGALLPLDGVLQGLSSSSSATTTTTSTAAVAQSSIMDEGHENKVMMGHQWQFGNNDNNIVDYNWNGAAGSYWHKVINGSLM